MDSCYKLLLTIGVIVVSQAINCTPDCFEPDTRVIGRWKNGNYYKGVVESLTNVISVLFDNGNRLSFNLHDRYDVLEDRVPDEHEIKWGDPVVVNRPHSFAYKPAHIREIVGGRYMIWYEDGSYIYQTKNDIRVFNKSIVCNEPAYLGCYRDQIPRYLTVFIPTRPATVGACVGMCNAQGYSIAALRNTDLCFCGNSYNKGYQTDNNKCDTPCFDNPYEMCGGSATFSQYWTGIVGDRPAHLPGGLLANKAFHMDPYGFQRSYTTAIAKETIPRYGKLPWHSIFLARQRTKTPISLANTSPWKWDASTSSWLRADGKHFHWNNNKLFGLEKIRAQTYINKGLGLLGKSWSPPAAPKLSYARAPSSQHVMHNGMIQSPMGFTKYPSMHPAPQDFRQYKQWHTPLALNKTMTNYANTIFAKTFTPQLVLQKLADKMAHVKWSRLSNFIEAYRPLPPAPQTFRYFGCFADDYQRDLPYYFPVYPLTTRSCILKCREHRYSVAGIQGSSQCYCSNSYGKYGRVREEQCNMKCTASPRDTCGGVLRNSLYYTGVGSAWPKTTATKKTAAISYNSEKPHKNALSRDSAVKLPSSKPSSLSNHGNHASTSKDKKQTKAAPKKIKARNKITNLPVSKHAPEFDDFQVESIKVKLNFSELKKALQTMSPSIVRRIQQDLQKINNLENQKHENRPIAKTGKDNKKPETVDYRKRMKNIREKLDKVAVNHLTSQNMKDILKIMNIPQSSFNIKTGVVNNKNVNNKQTIKHRDDNLAHEEIESYAKISLDYPFKRTNANDDSLNRKKELLKIIAKHVSPNQKDASKKVTNQNDSQKPIQKSDMKAVGLKNKLESREPLKKIKPVKTLHKQVKPVKSLDKQVKPVKSLDKQVKQVKSLDKQVKPVKSIDKQVKPVKSLDKEVKPIKSLDKQIKSVKSRDKKVKPVKSRDKEVKPVKSLEKQVKPIKSQNKQVKPRKLLDKQVKPVKSLDKQVKPVTSLDKQVKPINSLDKQVKPVKSLVKQVKPIKSMYKQVKPVKSLDKEIKPIKSLDKQVKPVKSLDMQVKPVKSLNKQVKPIKSLDKQVKPVKSLDKQVKPVKSFDKKVKPVKSLVKQVKPVKSFDKKVKPVNSLVKQVKPVKSFDKKVKPVKLPEKKVKPIQSLTKQVKQALSKVLAKSISTMTGDLKGKARSKHVSTTTEIDSKHLLSTDKSHIKMSEKKKTNANNEKTAGFEDALATPTISAATRQSLLNKVENKHRKESKEQQVSKPIQDVLSSIADRTQTAANNTKSMKRIDAKPSRVNLASGTNQSFNRKKDTSNKTEIQNKTQNDNETSKMKSTHNEIAKDHTVETEKNEAESEPNKNIGKKTELVRQPSTASSPDDNGVIYLGNDSPDEISSFDESLTSPVEFDGELGSGLSGLPSKDSNDENKLMSFQQNKPNKDHISKGETGSGIPEYVKAATRHQNTSNQELEISGDLKKITEQSQIDTHTNIIDDYSGESADGSQGFLGDDKSKYVYFGNGTIKEHLPLIKNEDLKKLLKQGEESMKRSITPDMDTTQQSVENQTSQEYTESSGVSPKNINQNIFTRSLIPNSKLHHSKDNKKGGFRVVKNGVAFTIKKGQQVEKLSKQKLLNSFRKKSKNLKYFKQNPMKNVVHKKLVLHHISERTDKKKNTFKDKKRDIADNENVDHLIKFQDDGARNGLISK